MAPMRTSLCLLAVLLPLSRPSIAKGPSPCPNEGETEIAKAGRTKDIEDCSVTHWSFYGKVGLSGTIEIVTAGTAGAVFYEHTTDAHCASQASSFSDQLSVCQGLPVANAWCKSQAYKVIEKRWETAGIDPCPNNDPISAILDYILHGEWPGCGELLPVTPVTHWSAQQMSCGVVTPEETQYGSYGQFELATGSPQASLLVARGAVSSPEEQALQALMVADDPSFHPQQVQAIGQDFLPIPGQLELSVQCGFFRYDVDGALVGTRQRTISGEFRGDGTYHFLCPQVAIDDVSKVRDSFLEEWTRDATGVYEWIHGGDRGLAFTCNGGLASSEQALQFPEVTELIEWMGAPFRLSYSASLL